MTRVSDRARVFWSTVVVSTLVSMGLATVVSPTVDVYWRSYLPLQLSCLGVALLGSLPRFLNRDAFASVVMVVACCAPWLWADFVLPGFSPELLSGNEPRHSMPLLLRFGLEGRALGAIASIGLLIAEALTQAWLGGARLRLLKVALLSVLLAVPFQLSWLYLDSFQLDETSTLVSLVVPVLAAVLIPLSLRNGGTCTVQVVSLLSVASVGSMAVVSGWFAAMAIFPIGCSPAPHTEVAADLIASVYPSSWLEFAPWPPLASCALALLVTKRSAASFAIVAAGLVVFLVDASSIVRLRASIVPSIATRTDNGCAFIVVDGTVVPQPTLEGCDVVYSREALQVSARSINALDHVRALLAVEPLNAAP